MKARSSSRSATAFGTLHTETYLLNMSGNSVPTMVWFAPELGGVPVRLEDQTNRRGGELGTLVELHGIERPASNDSALPEAD